MNTKHEQKVCKRCSDQFECKVGNITQCQCYGIGFTDAEKSYLDEKFDDCLCRNCLVAIKREYKFKPLKEKMRFILSLIKPK